MLTIEMLPAAQGDCIWIEYGERGAIRRLLVDGGTPGTHRNTLRSRVAALSEAERSFELLVVTHVDSDHIGGVLELVRDDDLKVRFGDIWFNSYEHLVPPDQLGAAQGDLLTDAITERGLCWNEAFGRKAVVVPDKGELPVVTLAGGLTLTLLSPTPTVLAHLLPVWERVTGRAGLKTGAQAGPEEGEPADESPPDRLGDDIDVSALAAGPFRPDAAPANGSSIALLLQYDEKRVLLAGDAHGPVLVASIRRLLGKDGARLAVDAVKLPHHGSRNNASAEFIKAIETTRYLFSTNGAVHHHPDKEAVARAIHCSPEGSTLHFNYASRFTKVWDDAILKRRYGYTAEYPSTDAGGLRLVL